MLSYMLAVMAVMAAALAAGAAHAQEPEVRLAAFQETAQVVVDATLSGNITASITLQTTNTQEIQIPQPLVSKISDNPGIISVLLTNREGCGVLGVSGQSCILVNVVRGANDSDILSVQATAKRNGDLVIGELNSLFDTNARYHSSYLHHRDELNTLLDTSGAISGRDIVSAIYTMPRGDTLSMYQKIAAMILAKEIRDAGGFYRAAMSLAGQENSHMAVSMLPADNKMLMQLAVSADYGGAAQLEEIDLLDYFGTNQIQRSKYFADGFYPLNSIIGLTMLSPDPLSIEASADVLPSVMVGGDAVPLEIGRAGWLFSSLNGSKIDGKYLFGADGTVKRGDLTIRLNVPERPSTDTDIVLPVVLGVFGAIAVIIYIRGFRPK